MCCLSACQVDTSFADDVLSPAASDRMGDGEEEESSNDMENFLFAILYEDEPKELM